MSDIDMAECFEQTCSFPVNKATRIDNQIKLTQVRINLLGSTSLICTVFGDVYIVYLLKLKLLTNSKMYDLAHFDNVLG